MTSSVRIRKVQGDLGNPFNLAKCFQVAKSKQTFRPFPSRQQRRVSTRRDGASFMLTPLFLLLILPLLLPRGYLPVPTPIRVIDTTNQKLSEKNPNCYFDSHLIKQFFRQQVVFRPAATFFNFCVLHLIWLKFGMGANIGQKQYKISYTIHQC